jgi:serine/threonine protein kinase
VLGQGGFGITYLGNEPQLKRPVAVKEFFLSGACTRHSNTVQPVTGMLADAAFIKSRDSFLAEGQNLAKFHHPSIVGVHATFEENNTAYLVMEFLKGKSLQSIIDTSGPVPVQDAMEYFRSIAEALEIVHNANILHLDIKPDNIMICDDGRAVLIDFGIAREFTARHTVTNQGAFTPGYAPIEQLGQKIRSKPATDVYALAATLYCALTGQIPVQATDRTMGVELPSPSKLNPQIPERVSDAIMWGMEVADSKRPQSARDFRQALAGARVAPKPQAGATGQQVAAGGSGPFRFAGGDTAYTAEELVGLLDDNWEESKKHLKAGGIRDWLYAIGRGDLALSATEAVNEHSNTDEALEKFIQSTKLLPPPQPRVQPDKLSFGRMEAGSSVKQAEIHIQNTGRGHLAGHAKSDDSSVTVTPSSFSGNRAVLTVSVDPTKVGTGKRYTHDLSVTTNAAKQFTIPVSFAVTFAWSQLLRPLLGWAALGACAGFIMRILYMCTVACEGSAIFWGIPDFSWNWIGCAIGCGLGFGFVGWIATGIASMATKQRVDAASGCWATALPLPFIPVGLFLEWLIAPTFSHVTSQPFIGWPVAVGVFGAFYGLIVAGKKLKRSDIEYSGYALIVILGVIMMLVSASVGVRHISIPRNHPSSQTSQASQMRVVVDTASVRNSPRKGAAVLFTLSRGDTVTKLGWQDRYYQIDRNGQRGWVYQNYVK